MNRKLLAFAASLTLALTATAQTDDAKKITVTGSIQSDILIPQEDEAIGTGKYDDWGLTNTYAEARLRSKYVEAGARVEFMKFPLPGFESYFKGWGVPHFYVKGGVEKAELTLGTFYEQFGSGFILRTYEERSLGIDNSLLGGRLVLRPVKGVNIKALCGKQRCYWDWNKALISGGDVELNVDQWSQKMQDNGTYLSLGASFVNKHENTDDDVIMADPTHRKVLPENVNSYDLRTRLQKGNFSILAEYAHKSQDPSTDNGYIYRKGYVAMLSTSYSKRGMSVLLQAKRSDNMASRSRRSMKGTSSFINHLPAFTLDHTYALAALYPYATQPLGEWAYQAEVGYIFKKKTPLGGKYGTNVKVNFSHVHAIDKNFYTGNDAHATNGYGSSFWKWGDQTYYQDLNVQLSKKLSKAFKLNLMYMNQFYNKTVVEGEGGMIHSDILVADGKYQFSKKVTLRGEAQYLFTDEDEGDWAFGLLELSLLPNWMVTVQDMYNVGSTHNHYYQGFVTFNKASHRLQLGYGRTRAGYNCSGGVCRYVPASKGLTLNYSYAF